MKYPNPEVLRLKLCSHLEIPLRIQLTLSITMPVKRSKVLSVNVTVTATVTESLAVNRPSETLTNHIQKRPEVSHYSCAKKGALFSLFMDLTN